MSERSNARAPISVLVPVKNEAANLRDCLASVSFAQEIVLVDSGSMDDTQAIADSAGARIVQFAWNGKFPRKKNWALDFGDLSITKVCGFLSKLTATDRPKMRSSSSAISSESSDEN